MYDPLVGRFLEEDPLDFAPGDPDLYRYVHNSPTNASDPSGNWILAANEQAANEVYRLVAHVPGVKPPRKLPSGQYIIDEVTDAGGLAYIDNAVAANAREPDSEATRQAHFLLAALRHGANPPVSIAVAGVTGDTVSFLQVPNDPNDPFRQIADGVVSGQGINPAPLLASLSLTESSLSTLEKIQLQASALAQRLQHDSAWAGDQINALGHSLTLTTTEKIGVGLVGGPGAVAIASAPELLNVVGGPFHALANQAHILDQLVNSDVSGALLSFAVFQGEWVNETSPIQGLMLQERLGAAILAFFDDGRSPVILENGDLKIRPDLPPPTVPWTSPVTFFHNWFGGCLQATDPQAAEYARKASAFLEMLAMFALFSAAPEAPVRPPARPQQGTGLGPYVPDPVMTKIGEGHVPPANPPKSQMPPLRGNGTVPTVPEPPAVTAPVPAAAGEAPAPVGVNPAVGALAGATRTSRPRLRPVQEVERIGGSRQFEQAIDEPAIGSDGRPMEPGDEWLSGQLLFGG